MLASESYLHHQEVKEGEGEGEGEGGEEGKGEGEQRTTLSKDHHPRARTGEPRHDIVQCSEHLRHPRKTVSPPGQGPRPQYTPESTEPSWTVRQQYLGRLSQIYFMQ